MPANNYGFAQGSPVTIDRGAADQILTIDTIENVVHNLVWDGMHVLYHRQNRQRPREHTHTHSSAQRLFFLWTE